MVEPLPHHYGLSQEQINLLEAQLKNLEAQQKSSPSLDDAYRTWAGISLAVASWIILYATGHLSSGGAKFIAGIACYFAGMIWIVIGAPLAFKPISQRYIRKLSQSLDGLRNSPEYHGFKKYLEAQASYNTWRERQNNEYRRAMVEWENWQHEFSKGQEAFWRSLDGHQFEVELANLYRALGYTASLTAVTGDDGVDIMLKKSGRTIVVQCKAHGNPVGPHVIRDLYGAMRHFNADEAILASMAGWTQGVVNFARGKPIKLIQLRDIIRMQSSLLKNMPPEPKVPPRPESHRASPNTTEYADLYATRPPVATVPSATRAQNIWCIGLPSVIGVAGVLVVSLLVPARPKTVAAALDTKQGAAATSTPTPTPYRSYSTPTPRPSPSPQVSPSPLLSTNLEEGDENVNQPSALAYNSPPAYNRNSYSLPANANSNIYGNSNSSTWNMNSTPPKTGRADNTSPPSFTYSPSTELSKDDQMRIDKSNELKSLGVDIDWRTYNWTEMNDMAMRIRKAEELSRLGLNVDWRKYSWMEMNDWGMRIRKAEELSRMGLQVNWQEHTWMEMNDWDMRIRKAENLRRIGIDVDWHNYTWMQLNEMEQAARRRP